MSLSPSSCVAFSIVCMDVDSSAKCRDTELNPWAIPLTVNTFGYRRTAKDSVQEVSFNLDHKHKLRFG